MGWIFIAFVCYGIFREYKHYIHVRLEYITNPLHAQLPQATSVLITQIPQKDISEDAMHKLFGGFPGGIKRIYFNRNLKELEKEIESRDKLAYKLEAAQIKLIKTANKLNYKATKGSKDDQRVLTDSEQGRGTAAKYVPAKKRPSHKLGFLGLLGKKVDTIDYCNQELSRLNPKITSMQNDTSSFKMMNSCFIQFHNQAAAQMCFQAVASRTAYAMHPRYTEIAPQDIVWSNMGLTWKSRMLRSTGTAAFVAALIIFWAIPVAFVGVLSNVRFDCGRQKTELMSLDNIFDAKGAIPEVHPQVSHSSARTDHFLSTYNSFGSTDGIVADHPKILCQAVRHPDQIRYRVCCLQHVLHVLGCASLPRRHSYQFSDFCHSPHSREPYFSDNYPGCKVANFLEFLHLLYFASRASNIGRGTCSDRPLDRLLPSRQATRWNAPEKVGTLQQSAICRVWDIVSRLFVSSCQCQFSRFVKGHTDTLVSWP